MRPWGPCMLRFTLHRPSQNSQVSTCCHGMSCRDVSCRVHVGVGPVPASHAHEGRLALATFRCDVFAGVTGLRRVRSFHFLDPSGCFLLQPAREQTPTGFEDAPVESGLLCDVPARVRHGPPRRAGHTFDVEVLDSDHVEAAGKAGGGLLDPVFAPVAVPGLQLADQGPHLAAAVRPAPGAGESALQPQEPLGFLHAQPCRAGHFTGGQRHRDSDAPVHADDAAGAGCGDRIGDRSERDMPTARPVACDAVRLPVDQCAAAFERNPADLRDQHTRPAAVVLTDPHSLRSHDPQALILAGFTPPRAPVSPREEPLPCLVKVTQRLLLDGLRPAGKPRLHFAGLGQLRGLGVEPRGGTLPVPPHQALLQAEVPHVSGVAALLQQEYLLRGTRIQTEPHTANLATTYDTHPEPRPQYSAILGAVAASSITCTSTWCSSPGIGVACSTQRCSTCVNRSWRRSARTSKQPWLSSTERKTMSTYSYSTRRRWRSPTSSTPSKASHPGGCSRTSSAGSTGRGCAASSGHRHTSPDHAAARHCPPSRTTSPTRNDQTRQGFLPAPKDRVSTPDHR